MKKVRVTYTRSDGLHRSGVEFAVTLTVKETDSWTLRQAVAQTFAAPEDAHGFASFVWIKRVEFL